jgi:hypothetical protein
MTFLADLQTLIGYSSPHLTCSLILMALIACDLTAQINDFLTATQFVAIRGRFDSKSSKPEFKFRISFK